MRPTRVFIAGILVVLCTAFGQGDDAVKKEPVKQKDQPAAHHNVLMEQKLKYAQQILAGLTQEDFAEIEKNAYVTNTIGVLESWIRADC